LLAFAAADALRLALTAATAAKSWSFPIHKAVTAAVTAAAAVALGASPAFADSPNQAIADVQVMYKQEKVPMRTLLGKEATLIIDYSGTCDNSGDGELGYQCKGLGELQQKYESQGVQVVMQLTEQFRDQSQLGEGDTAEDVREIMKKKFGWSFPILDYADVNGGDATELYKVLKEAKGISTSSTGLKKIDWNFEKILVDKNGVPIRRYRPSVLPEALDKDLGGLLKTGVLPKRVKPSLGA